MKSSAPAVHPIPSFLAAARLPALLALGLLAACSSAPRYDKPQPDTRVQFKESAYWQQANPQDAAVPDAWWSMFNDPVLDELQAKVAVNNETLRSSVAQMRVAQAALGSSRAALFPTVNANLGVSRSSSNVIGSAPGTSYSLSGSLASWEVDLWGRLSGAVDNARAKYEASRQDLLAAQLSTQATLAQSYFSLRTAEAQGEALTRAVDAYQRSLELTQNRYKGGVASAADVATAQSQLKSAQAQLLEMRLQRAQLEHAIAVLLGQAPSSFSLAPTAKLPQVPQAPRLLPATLLERRPDIAAAERTAAAANAKIGVAEAAFFPSLTLNAQGGFQHNSFSQLFSLPSLVWTLGPTLAATLFDAGAREAAVQGARATYEEDAALYRNTVLSAFQSVEDSLSASNHLQESAQAYGDIYHRNQQLYASAQSQQGAGTLSEQSLLTQRLTLLLAEQNLRDTQSQLTQSSITLIKNLGGGWQDTAQAGAAPR